MRAHILVHAPHTDRSHFHLGLLAGASGFVWGELGKNACPVGHSRIADAAACRTAAPSVGKAFVKSESQPRYPRGCYGNIDTTDPANPPGIYFNNGNGAGESDSQLLCAVGEPLFHGCPVIPHALRCCSCAWVRVRALPCRQVRSRRSQHERLPWWLNTVERGQLQ